jgi:hypothetical protein
VARIALAASIAACTGAGVKPHDAGVAAPEPRPGPGVDVFGTRNIYRSAAGAREWHAKWHSSPRVLRAGEVDPLDPDFVMRGSNQTLEIKGDGSARCSGDQIRMYVGDATGARRWLNVEVTAYGMRVEDRPGAGSTVGFEFQARTGDGHTSRAALNAAGQPVQCDGHSYGFSFRADGRGVLEKELKHPSYATQISRNVWDGAAFPKHRWIGMKAIVYGVDGGRHVKQELWRDLSDGANGGTWEKVLEHTDAGAWGIDPAIAESCGVRPDHIITTAEPVVILRSDGIVEQWLKKVTIREIEP